ncbi:MAG: transposase [Bacteroidetes bacterium]|nr:MAG: transposase [Bacteroidota bacterium]
MKPGTFTQLYTHLVFSPRHRERLLLPSIRPQIFSYISGIATNLGHKSIIINGFIDHVHILIGQNPNISLSDTVKEIKRSSSVFINEHRLTPGHFEWQSGYGAFSYCKSHLDRIYKYIENQEVHHSTKDFRTEYLGLLKEYDIPFEDRYLFEFFDPDSTAI